MISPKAMAPETKYLSATMHLHFGRQKLNLNFTVILRVHQEILRLPEQDSNLQPSD